MRKEIVIILINKFVFDHRLIFSQILRRLFKCHLDTLIDLIYDLMELNFFTWELGLYYGKTSLNAFTFKFSLCWTNCSLLLQYIWCSKKWICLRIIMSRRSEDGPTNNYLATSWCEWLNLSHKLLSITRFIYYYDRISDVLLVCTSFDLLFLLILMISLITLKISLNRIFTTFFIGRRFLFFVLSVVDNFNLSALSNIIEVLVHLLIIDLAFLTLFIVLHLLNCIMAHFNKFVLLIRLLLVIPHVKQVNHWIFDCLNIVSDHLRPKYVSIVLFIIATLKIRGLI